MFIFSKNWYRQPFTSCQITINKQGYVLCGHVCPSHFGSWCSITKKHKIFHTLQKPILSFVQSLPSLVELLTYTWPVIFLKEFSMLEIEVSRTCVWSPVLHFAVKAWKWWKMVLRHPWLQCTQCNPSGTFFYVGDLIQMMWQDNNLLASLKVVPIFLCSKKGKVGEEVW